MQRLNVSAEIGGTMLHVGTITGNDSADARFQYASDYRQNPGAPDLSISLPLREKPFSPAETACFFEGLLPEGFTRRSVAQMMHVDEGDYTAILHGLGRECLGAICVTEAEEFPQAQYEKISTDQVRELAAEGTTKSAEFVTRTHLSLTGASGKVGLYYSSDQDAWYLPKGTAPSTHIVKQSHVRLDSIITNERLALLTASRCGITTANSFIINTGNGEDHELLFATERYDRILPAKAGQISGLPRPYRLHQEDFAQAMGIPASQKYERESIGYMKGMFDMLRKHSSDPISDQTCLWDIIIFNYLIGNTDAHVKNISLLYSPNWKSLRLAPAYDIISTTVYEQSTTNMAFSIGGIYSIHDIDQNAFRKAAAEAGLGERMAMRRFEKMCCQFESALTESANELAAMGFVKAKEMKERILRSGGAWFTL